MDREVLASWLLLGVAAFVQAVLLALHSLEHMRFAHRRVRTDVLQYLEETLDGGWRYDLIVLDPPSFSNSKKMQMCPSLPAAE